MSRIINQNTEPLFIFDMPDDRLLSETISVKGEKGERGDPTKLSDLENDEGFITADTDALTKYYTKAETDNAIDADINALGVPDGFFTSSDTVSSTGSSITLENTADAKFSSITILGNTLQNGSPTPSSPVAVQVATGEQTITISGTSSQTYTLDLGDMELCKFDNYSDSIIYDGAKYYKRKSVEKIVLDGSESWVSQTAATGYVRGRLTISQTIASTSGACDHFAMRTGSHGAYDYCYTQPNTTAIYLQVNQNELTASTLDAFKAWLAANTTTVYYTLADPVDEEITDATLIAQLDALRAARSYAGSTSIAVSGSLPVLLSATAYRSNWSGTVEGITDELTDVVASDAQKATKDELDAATDGYIIDDITVDEYYDEAQLTHYWISHIPPKDADGNDIKMQLGLANDRADSSLRSDETVRSFAKRKNATLAINAGLFMTHKNSAYYKYPLGCGIKDGVQIFDYRTEIWNEGIATHPYLQRNRMLGVKPDMSLERFNYDATATEILNAGVDYTVTAFGAFLQNGKLTTDVSHAQDPTPSYTQTADETPNVNKIYFTLEDTEYIGHWRLAEFEAGVTYYEQTGGDFYAWQLLGQNTTTKDIYIFTCNGKGTTSEKGMTLEQAVAIFQALGCDWGFELDAGGSVSLVHKGEFINNRTDDQTDASSKADGRGITEREIGTYLYWAKAASSNIEKSIADTNNRLGDLSERVYDLEVASSGNEVVTNNTLFINDKTGGNQTTIAFQRDGTNVFSLVADYLQQGIFGLWDARNSNTVLRIHPNASDGIEFMGSKLSMLYDQTKDGGSSTDLNNLPFHTGIIRLNANYNLANAPFTSDETYFYYIIQLGLYGNGYNQRVQIAIPQIARKEINDGIRIRSIATSSWSEWRYINQTQAVPTAYRPTNFVHDGMMIFDTTLGKPIWYNGGNWYDATGTQV